MKKLLLLFLVAFVLCGCKESELSSKMTATGTKKSPHYITEYLVASEIAVDNKNGTLYLKVFGDEYATLDTYNIPKEAMFFINLYNDNSYNNDVYPGLSSSLAYPLDKISIYCDKDFDSEHQAGESLDNIVQLDYYSFYPFIENGYKRFIGKYDDRVHYMLNFDKVNAEVSKLVWANFLTTKISPSYIAKIIFSSAPDVLGEYTFTLEMTTNGKTLTTTFTYTFE